jgi:hypothetical protein
METASNSGALQSALESTSALQSEFEISPDEQGVIESPETGLTLTPFETYLKSEHPLAKIVGELPDMVRSLTTAKQFADVYSFLTANKTIVTPTIETWKSNPNNELENKVRALPEFAGLGITADKPPYWNESEYQSIVKHIIPLARKDDSHFLTLITSGVMSFVDIAKVQGIWNKWNLHTQSYATFTLGLNALSAKYELGRGTSENYIADLVTTIVADDEVQDGTYTVTIDKGNGTVVVKLTSENQYLIKPIGKTATTRTSTGKLLDGEKELSTADNFANGGHCPEILTMWRTMGAKSAESYAEQTKNSKAKRIVRCLNLAAERGITWQYTGSNGDRQYYDLTIDGKTFTGQAPANVVKTIAVNLGWAYIPQ